ncbi:MAG: transcriptional regulator [Methanomethylovorans sp.]|nr:transcriptional regulator [Methanomethylovorans sp.]
MKTTCEIMVQKVLPAIRAEIARVLFSEHRCTQQEIAEILCLSRAAVSQYMSEKRGAEVDFSEDVHREIRKFSARLLKEIDQKEQIEGMCNICRYVQRSGWFYKNLPEAVSCSLCGDKEQI